MTAKVVQLEVGQMANFTYIIADEENKVAAIVDPSWDLDKIYETLDKKKWHVEMIINTHNHFDHVIGNEQVASRTGAPIVQHEQSTLKGKHVSVSDGETVKLGQIKIKVLHTPGHSKESICLLINGKFVLTGDTLFVEDCGASGPALPRSQRAAGLRRNMRRAEITSQLQRPLRMLATNRTVM